MVKINNINFEYRIVVLYLVIGILWIYFSDSLFDVMIPDKETQTKLSIAKGFFFIITTSILLYLLVKQNNSRLRDARNQILKQNEKLKSANNTLFKAKEKSQESDKLKTAFIQNMSHEIRTPMNGIIGFSELLEREGISEEKKKQYTNIIIENSRQLLSIVNDIITISTLEASEEKLHLAETDINQVLTNVYENFSSRVTNKGLDFSVMQLPEGTPHKTMADATKLTQILNNLLSNALKFTEKGVIHFGCQFREDLFEFYVEDTGIGIAPEHREKIFNRFTQVDISSTRHRGGNGLGLSISKAFVELMEGSLAVESLPGKGSRFYFTIPFTPPDKKETAGKTGFKARLPFTVLIAEDEENNFLYIQEFLESYEITILRAHDGLESVEICKENPDIDLVLMDIKMPKMDGYTAAKRIKEQRKDLPVIAQTAYALESEINKYKDVFDDYITKPIMEDTLNAVLEKFSQD